MIARQGSGTATLRDRVLRGDHLLGTFIELASPIAVEICALSGFDWVMLDLEHGVGTEADLLPQMLAASAAGAAPLVRVETNAPLRISRVLDLGATGVMIPRVDTAVQAQAAVAAWRYPPGGNRGVALMTRAGRYGKLPHADMAPRNDDVLGIVQIESPLAVQNATEIAQVPGVDILFVGPTDLTHAMGIPGRFNDSRFLDARRSVCLAAVQAGKVAGIIARDMADAAEVLDVGYRFVGFGTDGSFMTESSDRAAKNLKQLVADRPPVATKERPAGP